MKNLSSSVGEITVLPEFPCKLLEQAKIYIISSHTPTPPVHEHKHFDNLSLLIHASVLVERPKISVKVSNNILQIGFLNVTIW